MEVYGWQCKLYECEFIIEVDTKITISLKSTFIPDRYYIILPLKFTKEQYVEATADTPISRCIRVAPLGLDQLLIVMSAFYSHAVSCGSRDSMYGLVSLKKDTKRVLRRMSDYDSALKYSNLTKEEFSDIAVARQFKYELFSFDSWGKFLSKIPRDVK